MMMYADPIEKNPVDELKVGDGLTYCIFTDRRAGTVIARTEKTITMRCDKATLLNGYESGEPDALMFTKGGFVGHTSGTPRYSYEPDPEGAVHKFSRREFASGRVVYKLVGHGKKSPGCSAIAGRHEHYDFNF